MCLRRSDGLFHAYLDCVVPVLLVPGLVSGKICACAVGTEVWDRILTRMTCCQLGPKLRQSLLYLDRWFVGCLTGPPERSLHRRRQALLPRLA